MFDKIIHFSVKNKLIIGFFVLVLVVSGIFSLRQIPIDAVPDITNNQVQVITVSPTLGAEEVENFITYPVEIRMQNLPGVVEIRSISRLGLSVVTVVFEDDMGTYLPRQLVGEKLKLAEDDIPKGMGTPEMAPISTGLGEIYQYVVRPDSGYEGQYTPTELRTIQDWIVKRQLSGIEGVVEVNSFGGFLKQYEVAIDPERLRAMNITIEEVNKALEENNQNTGGSYVEKGPNAYFIRGKGMVNALHDIEQIIVKKTDGAPVLIRHVAEVKFGHPVRYGALTRNGKGEVVGGIVMMLKGANSAKVTERIKKRVEEVQQSLPEGIVIDPFLDRSKLVNNTIGTVSKNLIEGGLIVIFVLVLLLGNFRAGLIVASVIPLSMLFALNMMNIFGVSANLMSLGAIDFGLIVDGAVIIVESIVHRLRLKHKGREISQKQMDNDVGFFSTKIRKSAAFGEIIILIVYIPVLALSGIEGKMFKPMAQTVSFAIFGALILSLTYVPMMSALFLKKKMELKKTISDRLIEKLQNIYRPVIEFALKRKAVILIVAFSLFGISIYQYSKMGGEFIPTLEEGDFALHQILPPGSSIQEGVEVSAKIQRILLDKFPEVEEVVTKIGTAETPTDPMPMEAGDIMVIMKDKDEWVSAETKEEMFNKMEKELSVIPGVIYEFTQPIQMRFNELMTGVRQDIAVKIYGENLGILREKGKAARGLIREIEGVGDIQLEQTGGLPQMVVDYDREKLAQYNVNVNDLNNIIKTAFAGYKTGVVFENERRFDLVVRLKEVKRNDLKNIGSLYVPLGKGVQVPLKELASISMKKGPVQISRDNAKRRIVIGVNARNRDVESLVNEIDRTLRNNLDLPAGYHITYGGQFENLKAARKRLSIAVPAALLLIFFLLFLTFNSLKQALLIFTAIPLSAIGGIWALELRGMPFSISAGVGFIALFGVAVLNGIVLISYFNELEKEGIMDIKERILEGTKVRLRPVIMTASVASLGFLPMALSNSAGAEVQKPLATVVIGGLITATLLTMIVLPILYLLFHKKTRITGKATAILLVAGMFLTGSNAFAQEDKNTRQLTLEDAVQIALSNNPVVKAGALEVQKQTTLQKQSVDLGKTKLYYSNEESQFGGTPGVVSMGITQSFDFPSVYAEKSRLQKQKVLYSKAQKQLTENDIRKEVMNAYFNLAYLYEKLALAQKINTLYQKFGEAAQLRYNTGEASYLETLIAEKKSKEIHFEQQQLTAQLAAHRNELKKWLNVDDSIDIATKSLERLTYSIPENRQQLQAHPQMQLLEQEVKTAQADLHLQKKQLLPSFYGQYANQQINGNSGFYAYQLGINVPLWFVPQRARIQAAKVDAEQSRLFAEARLLDLQANYQKLLGRYVQLQKEVNYYEKEWLLHADQIISSAEKGYKKGMMSYLEYTQAMEEALDIKEKYLNRLLQYDLVVIQLKYLTGYDQDKE